MEVVQLASKALRSPHPYDPSYEGEHAWSYLIRSHERAYFKDKLKFAVLLATSQWATRAGPATRGLAHYAIVHAVYGYYSLRYGLESYLFSNPITS